MVFFYFFFNLKKCEILKCNIKCVCVCKTVRLVGHVMRLSGLVKENNRYRLHVHSFKLRVTYTLRIISAGKS